jgi:predicted ATP-grasp superfamily ATP-dependent carboligase
MANVTVTLPYECTVNSQKYPSGTPFSVDSVIGNGLAAMVVHANTGIAKSKNVSTGSLPVATVV